MQNLQDVMDQDSALTIPCRYCGAAVGEQCMTTDRHGVRHPLKHFPAHPSRIRRVARLDRLEAFDTERAGAGQ